MSEQQGVETYREERPAIEMTAAALEHVRSFYDGDSSGKVLRIGATESGCSGYMYVLDFAEAAKEGDHRCQVAEDVVVYIEQDALALLRGTRLDYVVDGLNSYIKFDNPNATAHCGCGESFTVGDPAGKDATDEGA